MFSSAVKGYFDRSLRRYSGGGGSTKPNGFYSHTYLMTALYFCSHRFRLLQLSLLASSFSIIRDWSKSIGGGGPEHLEMWLIKNT